MSRKRLCLWQFCALRITQRLGPGLVRQKPCGPVENRFLRLGVLDRVVDALVDHFLSFKKEQRQLPVVWHQSLLCFVQRWHLLALALYSSLSDYSPGAGLRAPPVLLLTFRNLSKRSAAG